MWKIYDYERDRNSRSELWWPGLASVSRKIKYFQVLTFRRIYSIWKIPLSLWRKKDFSSSEVAEELGNIKAKSASHYLKCRKVFYVSFTTARMTYVVCHLPIVPNEKATNPLCSMGKVQTVNLTQSSSEGKLPTKQTCSQCSLSLCWSLTLLLPFITACSQIDFTLLFHFTVKAFCTYRCVVCVCVCVYKRQTILHTLRLFPP